MATGSLPIIYPNAMGKSTLEFPLGLRASLRKAWPRVWPLVALGFVLRLLFLLVGAKLYYAGRQIDIYTNGDSYSYVLSFRNLLEYGRYTFDLTEPDAAVGRLPGYPFFYGLHYLVFGPKWVLAATAFTQVLLDTLGIWLIYAITVQLAGSRSWAPLIAAVLLAFYPFSIVWTTVTGTETLGLFLVLLWWAMLILCRPRTLTWVGIGMLLAVIIYVREFLGACLVVTLLYLFLKEGGLPITLKRLRPATLVLAGFMLLYAWWPIRNYVTMGRFIPLKPAAAGYGNLREDAQAALAWVLVWTNDTNLGFDEILYAEKPSFPAHVISTPAEHQLIDSLVVLSRNCGSSFAVRIKLRKLSETTSKNKVIDDDWRYMVPQRMNTLRNNNCNDAISKGFYRLRAGYIARHPIRAWIEVPLQNAQKILFKNQLQNSGAGHVTMAQRLIAILFTWRSILLALGLIGAWRHRRQAALWPALLFAAVIFGYMASIFRSLEMRYLLQADVLFLVPAALLLASWLPRRWASQ